MTPEQQSYCDYVRPYAESVVKDGTVRFDTTDPSQVYVFVSHPAILFTSQGLTEIQADMSLYGAMFEPWNPGSWTPDPKMVRRALAHAVVDEVAILSYPQALAAFVDLSTPLDSGLPLFP